MAIPGVTDATIIAVCKAVEAVANANTEAMRGRTPSQNERYAEVHIQAMEWWHKFFRRLVGEEDEPKKAGKP